MISTSAWWDLQIVQASSGIEDGELAEGCAGEAAEPPDRPPFKESLGVAASKQPDHSPISPTLGVGTPGDRVRHECLSRTLNSPVVPPSRPAQHLAAFLPQRGEEVFAHRKPISGSVNYRVSISGPWRWSTACPGTMAAPMISATCRPCASAAMPANARLLAYAGHVS